MVKYYGHLLHPTKNDKKWHILSEYSLLITTGDSGRPEKERIVTTSMIVER